MSNFENGWNIETSGNPNWDRQFDATDARLNVLLQRDFEVVRDSLKKRAAEAFAKAHEEWTAEQEQLAGKYIWIRAEQIDGRTTICEQGHGRKIMRYRVTEIHPARSRFDRKVVVTVDKTRRWVYDPKDLVMVLA